MPMPMMSPQQLQQMSPQQRGQMVYNQQMMEGGPQGMPNRNPSNPQGQQNMMQMPMMQMPGGQGQGPQGMMNPMMMMNPQQVRHSFIILLISYCYVNTILT
jgi:hypothetical protein